MGNEQTNARAQHAPTLPSNARLMNTAIKQRLQKGNAKSTYNMKVIIRGDRQTGKSALFHRLEGGGFIKEHRTTEQIQCSHVLWPYKTSDEMVNLEIWDVVDKAIVPTNIIDDPINGISAKPSIVSKNLLPADATTIAVYKGAHAIIFMVDPTRKWTLDYVKTNISQIPQGIDCVIVFGKKDLNQLWTLADGEIEEFMSQQPKNVRSLQISLQDCYGMKELHSFFNVPFLRMKAKYLQQELQRAQREYEQSKVELDIFINHQNYNEFLVRLKTLKDNKSRKIKPPSISPPAPKVKQTVHSSKDLPLIQEQQIKEEAKKKEEEQKKEDQKKEEIKQATKKKLENIDTFKPIGGLDDDFFADLGCYDESSENEDQEGNKQNTNGHNVDDENNENDNDNNNNKKNDNDDNNDNKEQEHIGFDVDDDDDEEEDAFDVIQLQANDTIANIEHDINIGEKQTELAANGHKKEAQKTPTMESYSRMPDLKLNASNSSGKLQALMKLKDAQIESSDSDEYDDEPLVFATPKVIKKSVTPTDTKETVTKYTKPTKISVIKIEKKDEEENNVQNKIENRVENDSQQNAFDAFLDNLTATKTKESEANTENNKVEHNQEENDEEIIKKKKKEERRRRRKEKKEKKRKKKKKKKHKHNSDDEDEDESSEYQNSKKKKRRKKKKKRKHKEKESDLIEYESSSDNVLNIE